MTLTKQDIDALVDGLPGVSGILGIGTFGIPSGEIRKALYLAAGLTAEGERKPERVRCWQVSYPRLPEPAKWFSTICPEPTTIAHDAIVTPGWFVPDGEGGG